MKDFVPFRVMESPDNDYKAIVVSLSSESLTDNMEDIKLELFSAGINGKILFDYLLSTGQNNKRFFEIEFNGDFLIDTFHNTVVSDIIKKHLYDFYCLNYQYIANSLLSEPLKYVYRHNARDGQ